MKTFFSIHYRERKFLIQSTSLNLNSILLKYLFSLLWAQCVSLIFVHTVFKLPHIILVEECIVYESVGFCSYAAILIHCKCVSFYFLSLSLSLSLFVPSLISFSVWLAGSLVRLLVDIFLLFFFFAFSCSFQLHFICVCVCDLHIIMIIFVFVYGFFSVSVF